MAVSATPPGAATVRGLIDRAAGEWPRAVFLIDPDSGLTLTYAGVREHAEALASRLRGNGLEGGDRVAVAIDNGPAAVVSLLATMWAGLVPVPLDPGTGRSPLTYVLQHCDARLVLVARERRTQMGSIAANAGVAIDSIEIDELATPPSPDPAPPPSPDDDGLLMYTSGSTGRPKGVLVSQVGLVARAANSAAAHELSADDRLLCVLPLYHMSALVIVLGILHSGGSIVMPPRFRLDRYWEWVATHRCTWLGVVPTIVAQLLRRHETHPRPSQQHGVRFARCSSAPLSDAAHRAFEASFGILLVQGMGMTEAGAVFLNPPHRDRRKIGALGRPCGLDVRIVGPDGRELGCGEAGEILVRGPGVMRGYYKDAAATARAFDAEGWLRTGDRGRRDDDGYFFHAGRAKELIIKAGTNIAPREIDEALASHPDVVEAAAVGVPDPNLGEDIGAFVVLRDRADCNERALLDHCAARLGEFKTPSWISAVDALPAGPSGKILRAQLVERALARAAAATADHMSGPATDAVVAPRTAVERALAAAWTAVLERDGLSIHDDFFALGGTSLLALRLTARLRQALDVQLSLSALLGAPTIAAQAALVERRRRAPAADAEPPRDDAPATAVRLGPIGGGGVPLFCVYDIARFIPLARLLAPAHSVYGVSIGAAITALAGRDPTATFSRLSVEKLARACTSEIRRVQSAGPYQVAGFSFGGRIALEVGQQLRATGAEVQLVIFDTFMPGAFRRRPVPWLALQLAALRRDGPRALVTKLRRRWPSPDAIPAPSDDAAAFAHRESSFRRDLGRRYRPRPFDGTIVLFRATANEVPPHFRTSPSLGWTRLARRRLSIHDVAAAHLELLDEQRVPIVAAALQPHLLTR